jgi:F0F1-type ATP synthase assembly protein I
MNIARDIFGILTLIIIVAIVAVLVSQRANTANVISAFAGGLSQLLSTVVSPVTMGGNNN